MKPTAIPEHIGWSTAFNINCEKHHDYAGNGRCPECLAQEIERLKAELANVTKRKDTLVMRAHDLGQGNEILKDRLAEAQADNKQLREGLRRALQEMHAPYLIGLKTELAKLLEGRE